MISRKYIYISVLISYQTIALNCLISCVSLKYAKIWYCCEFVLVLQDTSKIKVETSASTFRSDLHGPTPDPTASVRPSWSESDQSYVRVGPAFAEQLYFS